MSFGNDVKKLQKKFDWIDEQHTQDSKKLRMDGNHNAVEGV